MSEGGIRHTNFCTPYSLPFHKGSEYFFHSGITKGTFQTLILSCLPRFVMNLFRVYSRTGNVQMYSSIKSALGPRILSMLLQFYHELKIISQRRLGMPLSGHLLLSNIDKALGFVLSIGKTRINWRSCWLQFLWHQFSWIWLRRLGFHQELLVLINLQVHVEIQCSQTCVWIPFTSKPGQKLARSIVCTTSFSKNQESSYLFPSWC